MFTKSGCTNPARKKKLLRDPLVGVAQMPAVWSAILLAQALEHAGRAELAPLLRASVDVLDAMDRPRSLVGGVLDRFRTWPHRIDLDERRAELLARVLRHWRGLDQPCLNRLLARPASCLHAALAETARLDPVSAATWIESYPDWVYADSCVDLMLNPDRQASRVAASALVEMVKRGAGLSDRPGADEHAGPGVVGLADDAGFAAVLAQLRRAVRSFDQHQQRGVMTTALLLAESPESPGAQALGLADLEELADHPAASGLRAAFRRGTDPWMRARAWRWMKVEAVRAAAVARVGRAYSPAEHEALLSCAYLVLHPVRRSTLRVIKVRTKTTALGVEPMEGEALPDLAVASELSDVSRRWLVDLTDAVRPSDAVRVTLRARGLTDPSAWVRFAHMRTGDPLEQADYAFDRDARVARSAVLARSPAGTGFWSRWPMRPADRERARLAAKLARSPHEQVRTLAQQDQARVDPWCVRDSASRLAALQWLRSDRTGFLHALRSRLEGGSMSERIDAVRLARLLRIVPAVEPILLAIAGDESEDARLVATAVAALGDSRTPTARDRIERAFHANDDRVRANAVEAQVRSAASGTDLAAVDATLYGSLIELKSDGHHRVRANALRGLIERTGVDRNGHALDASGIDGLVSILGDERGMHRLAGLWLAERVLVGRGRMRVGSAWDGLCRRVAAMASRDTDDQVRTRATRCARRLLAEIRTTSRHQRQAA